MEYAIIFFPLIGSIIGYLGGSLTKYFSEITTSLFVSISGVLSVILFYNGIKKNIYENHQILEWISSGNFVANWSINIDPLSSVMLVVVTFVSALVHIYSIGYMSQDPHKPRFMSYLSLFTFSMLVLVVSDNFLQLFFGWEAVGLCSYLLIGFWYKKESANNAAIKAFIVNRVGDFGLAIGIFLIFFYFGTINFKEVFELAPQFLEKNLVFLGFETTLITLICIFLFIGAMGKSAQFLLHTWLPDAMEGPTPVSALIHAATMVTAGVFLVARCSPLFELSPDVMTFIVFIGATTAIFAASVALVQNDIKRVIAYSTCSQLGYMFVALGVGAYQIGIFHLFTHAFFKALLFLGAGSVIHAMSNEQDMRNMGGLRKYIPKTYILMLAGTLALTGFGIPGVFGMAGFYSKDAIIEAAFVTNLDVGTYAFAMLLIAALMTSFYSWRLVFLTFHGKTRASDEVISHIHESPNIMLFPLFILFLGAIFSGYLFYDSFIDHGFKEFWASSIFILKDNHILEEIHHVSYLIKWSPTIMMVLGVSLSYYLYVKNPKIPSKMASEHEVLYNFLLNKWYFDEIYNFIFVKPVIKIGKIFWKSGDENIINRYGPDGISKQVTRITKKMVQLQTGYIYHYAFSMIIGLSFIITFYIIVGRG